ncbi:hypothetical protein Tco_0025218 [Tanacetum coccineum]
MTRASSKKLKTGNNDVNVEAPSHGVPHEEKGATPSQNVSREEVVAPSHSQDIPDAQVKVPSQKATIEDVAVPSNFASTAQHTPSSLKKELLPTGLGSINTFYRKENSRKCFTSLREILHLVTKADLMTIYGRVMTFYQDKIVVGVGLVLWGDLKVLMDSPEVNDGSDVWKNQHTWRIQSWKLYSFFGVHVLETVSGLVLHMFMDKKYPLSVNLIERMLDHQLEICNGTMGNEITTAVQLIAFLKKQISNSRRPKVHDWPTLLVLMRYGFQFPGYPKLDGFHLPYSWNEKWLVQEGTTLGKDYIKSVNGCDDLPKIIRDLNSPMFHVPKSENRSRFDVEFHVAVKEYAIGFKMLLFNPLAFSKKDLSKNLK